MNMSGYDLSHRFYEWAFSNRQDFKPTISALYFYLVEVCNKLGWKDQFSISAKECMEGMGVSSYNTYKSAFDVLCQNGFITVVKKSCNHYQANIITLSNFNKVTDKVTDKVNTEYLTEYSEGNSESNCDILKTIKTLKTIKQEGRFTPPTPDQVSQYITENNYCVNSQKFIDHYTSNGWKVGKNPMRNWQAAVRTWELSETKNSKTLQHPFTTPVNSKRFEGY